MLIGFWFRNKDIHTFFFFFKHFSLTGIFTRDISTSSSAPGQDYGPLLEVLSHDITFERNERMKQVSIDIIDDSLYETDEVFEVVLKSDVQEQLDFPSRAEVTIKSDDGKLFNPRPPKGGGGSCCNPL